MHLDDVTLWLFANTYNFTATPPTGSGYFTTSTSRTISGNTNFTMTLPQPVTFSGYVHDANGNILPGQYVYVNNNNDHTRVAYTHTDNNGFFTLTVAPATYQILFETYGSTADGTPPHYAAEVNNYSLNQDTTNLNITLPFKKVDIHVEDSSNNGVGAVSVSTDNPALDNVGIGSGLTARVTSNYSPGKATNQSGDVTLWLFNNTYNFTATPPTGSNYYTTSTSKTISSDTNFTIVLLQPVTLSGYIHDALGNILPGQYVRLKNGSTYIATTIADSNGYFSLTAAPATYTLELQYIDTNYIYNLPTNYLVQVDNYSLTQDVSNLNVTLPLRKVDVHVEDAGGNGIGGVKLSANNIDWAYNLNIGGGITTARGTSVYNTPGRITNASGDVSLWLFANTYNFTVTSPSGSIYQTTNLNNVVVSGNQTQLISLQFIHAAPVTAVVLSPAPNAQNEYEDPTTVTLSAQAASGFSITNTYYTVDGGSQQTYSSPFIVSGEGSHDITYWSVDNAGVYELPKTTNFTIHQNVAPVVGTINVSTNPLLIATELSTSATYTDPGDTGTHTAIWDWGDGATSNGTVNESTGLVTGAHLYASAGVYTVTLAVTDDESLSGSSIYEYVSVYNPTSQGLFTAGQRFNSPAGAYIQNPNLTGIVRFGLSYKYQGSIPVGDRQFMMSFDAANFDFNATTVTSLVVTNGIATLRGTGTLNGSGSYTFLVVGNNSANTVRIQIKDQSGTVVYDTQPGAPDTASPTVSVTGNIIAHE